MVEIGEVREAALWYVTEDQRVKAEKILSSFFEEEGENLGVIYSDLEFYSDMTRVPEPPEPGAKILIGEARVVAIRSGAIDTHFLNIFTPSQLRNLREITQRAYLYNHPGSMPLPDHNLDQLIASVGPESLENMLRSS